MDLSGRPADGESARPSGAGAVDAIQPIVRDRALSAAPGLAAGAVEDHRPAIRELEAVYVVGDVPVEWEERIVAGRRAADLLLDRDRPARRRWEHEVLVAEDVVDPARERDALGVVALVVVIAAAQRPEGIRRISGHGLKELLREHRVGRRTALQPKGPLPLVGHV